MRIELTGRLRVLGDDGTTLDGADFRGRQCRLVFAYLASTPDPVPRETLAELLWPHRLPGAWRRDLAAVVSKLRARLTRLGVDATEALRGGDDCYHLVISPRPVLDVDEAAAALVRAESALGRGDLAAAARAAQVAAQVARRPFLPAESGDWVARQRDRLDGLLLRALDVLAEAERPAAAVRCAEEAIALRPLRETGHLRLMRAHLRAGDRAEALRAHARCRRLLRDQLGVDPMPEIQAAFREALRPGTGAAAARPPLPSLLSRPDDRFVGRTDELASLREMLAGTGERPRIVQITGDPGIGKTRLAQEFGRAAHGTGAIVLLGRCDRDRIVPYQPFAEALGHVVDTLSGAALGELTGVHAPDLTRLLPRLGERLPGVAAPPALEPDTARLRLFEGVTAVLVALARTAPVVVVVDDLQWADRSTLALLRHVLRCERPARLLVVATCRDNEVAADHPLTAMSADLYHDDLMSAITVTSLDRDEVAVLLDRHAAIAPQVHRLTAGNPFFVRQLVRHLIETGAPDIERAGLPPGVTEVVRHRLALLKEDAWRSLTVGAVIGPRFGTELVARVTGLGEPAVLDAFERACAARLLVELPGGFAFVHDLVREAAYAQLGLNRRAVLHRAVAEAIEASSPGSVGELARHYGAAGRAGRDKAVRYAVEAAEAASAQLAHDDAARYYGAALAALPEDGSARRAELLLALGTARLRAGDPRAGQAFHRASELAQEDGHQRLHAEAALGVAAMWAPTGAVDRARVDLLSAALAELPTEEDRLRARLLSRLATARYWEVDPAPRAALSAEAVAIARRVGDPATLATCLDARNAAVWGPGDVPIRRAGAREIVALADAAGELELAVPGRAWGITSAVELGERAELDTELAAYCALADELRQPRYRWYARSRLAMRAILSGEFTDGARLAAEGREIALRTGEPDAENLYLAGMFPAWIESADSDPAKRIGAIEYGSNERVRHTVACARLLWESLAGARPAAYRAGLRRLADPVAQPLDMHWAFNVACLAGAAARQHDREQAERLIEALHPHTGTGIVWAGAAAFFGAAEHWLGLLAATLGHWTAAERHLSAALDFHERLGAAPWVARSRYELARVLLATDRRARSEDLLTAARRTAGRLHMSTLAADIAAATEARAG